LQQTRHEQGEKKLSYAGLCKALTEWKAQPETLWLKETHSQPLQQTLKDLERAYANFFEKRADFPRFKKKGQSDSFRFPQGIKLDQGNSRVFLPKLGWMRFRKSRQVLGEVRSATVSQSGGKWFVSILTERTVEKPIPQGGAVGIDVGIARFATFQSRANHLTIFKVGNFLQHQPIQIGIAHRQVDGLQVALLMPTLLLEVPGFTLDICIKFFRSGILLSAYLSNSSRLISPISDRRRSACPSDVNSLDD
jgi:transposase